MNALDRKIASSVTPGIVAKDAMIFQPSDERRRSGSHYTPSSLTGPIVEAALAPVLKQLGDNPTPAQILNLKVCDPAMGSGAFLVEACRQLGSALSRAWHAHNEAPVLPPDEDEALHAQRQIAQRCLYGVDKNPMATDLAKLSLWLATLAKDHPFTFLDHSLRAGDSLVGLTRKQIAAFDWKPSAQMSLLEERIRKTIETVSNYRQQILAARDDVPYALLKQKLDGAEDALSLPRQIGDAVVAAFFAGEKAKDRENVRTALSQQLTSDIREHGFIAVDGVIDAAITKLKAGAKSILPFHWELEFPEVFLADGQGEQTGGFDVIVGNPPFAGKNTFIAAHQDGYSDWLKTTHEGSHGNADLVAHFFRRAFSLLRKSGCMGLIATNTIGQGDTRSTGLRWICVNGGTIYRATKRLRWPGEAAVVISVIHILRGIASPPYILNDHLTDKITAYLFHAGPNEDPALLRTNADKGFQGNVILGLGFTFDDMELKGKASSIAEMKQLIEKDPRNAERIFPYIGGEEVNSSPTQAYHRYVIKFDDYPLERTELGRSWQDADDQQRKFWLREYRVPPDYPLPVASDWPDLLDIVERKVKPERLKQASIVNPKRWWMFARPGTELKNAIRLLDRVLVTSQISKYRAYTFLPSGLVFDQRLVVFADQSWEFFATMSSRLHEIWASFLGSTFEDRLIYTPSDCFESFPFPILPSDSTILATAGSQYFEKRATFMAQSGQGLTSFYNAFHNPNEHSPEMQYLRELHNAMDYAVLDAYGWQDIQPACDFFSEFEDEEEEGENGRQIRRGYRYRWPDEIHDEVLARLLEFNRQRALEEGQLLAFEQASAAADPELNRRTTRRVRRDGSSSKSETNLFAAQEQEG
jgi:hypothetical protein